MAERRQVKRELHAPVVIGWRLALFVGGPFLFFLPVALAIATLGWRYYLGATPQPANEGFFWASTTAIPLGLLAATWLLPRRASPDLRAIQVHTPGQTIPVAFYDDLRVAFAWVCFVALVLVALFGMVMGALALADCSVVSGSCGTMGNHRLSVYGLIASGGSVIALLGARLLGGLSLVEEPEEEPDEEGPAGGWAAGP